MNIISYLKKEKRNTNVPIDDIEEELAYKH